MAPILSKKKLYHDMDWKYPFLAQEQSKIWEYLYTAYKWQSNFHSIYFSYLQNTGIQSLYNRINFSKEGAPV